MIIVTGATGALNGSTMDHLLERVDRSELVIVARDQDKAVRYSDQGVQVRHGDYDAPETLPAAFDGADQLLLVSPNDPTADAPALMQGAIDAAVSVGVGRVLYTSHQGAAPDTPFFPGRDHWATEQALAASGLPWTSLRNGFYAHSLAWLLGPWRETGVITVPADGPVSWTARSDAAEAAAHILTAESGSFDGPVTITAPAAPTFAEVAEIASEVAGAPIGLQVVEPEDWVAGQVAAGQQEFAARFLLGMYQAAAGGYFAGTDPTLQTLLGHEPRTVFDELADPSGH